MAALVVASLPASASAPRASSRISSPVGVRSTTKNRLMSVSTLLRNASSISAAPASTTSAAESGNSMSRPRSSSWSSTISSTNPSIAGASANRVDRGRGVVPDREDRIEPANRKHLLHARGEPEQGQLALRLLHFSGDEQQGAQPGAADIVKLRQVDRKVRRAASDDS